MDGMVRKDKYAEQKDLVSEALSQEVIQTSSIAETRLDKILEKLRSSRDADYLNMAFAILAGLLCLICVVSFIKDGFTFRLVPLILFVLFVLYYRSTMKSRGLANIGLGQRLREISEDEASQLSNKIQYVQSGIETKETRLRMVRLFYIVFFPLVMYLFTDYFRDFQGMWIVIGLVVAFAFSYPVWDQFFDQDIDDLHKLNIDVEDLKKEVYASGSVKL